MNIEPAIWRRSCRPGDSGIGIHGDDRVIYEIHDDVLIALIVGVRFRHDIHQRG